MKYLLVLAVVLAVDLVLCATTAAARRKPAEAAQAGRAGPSRRTWCAARSARCICRAPTPLPGQDGAPVLLRGAPAKRAGD